MVGRLIVVGEVSCIGAMDAAAEGAIVFGGDLDSDSKDCTRNKGKVEFLFFFLKFSLLLLLDELLPLPLSPKGQKTDVVYI